MPKTHAPCSIIALFFILSFGFGFNFGFIKICKGKLPFLAKVQSYLSSTAISILLFVIAFENSSTEDPEIWYFMDMIQYSLYCVTVHSSKYNLFDFFKDLSKIDVFKMEMGREMPGVLALIYSAVIFFSKFIFQMTHCDYFIDYPCRFNTVLFVVHTFSSLAGQVMSIVFILINYYMYSCICKLKLLIENSVISVDKIQGIYLNLSDCNDKIRRLYDKLTVVELLIEGPSWMLMIFNTIKYYQEGELNGWFDYTYTIIEISHSSIKIVTPSILAEMMISKMEAIILTLNYQLLTEQDTEKSKSVRRLLRYMKRRRLDGKVWRVIPIDLQLPLNLLSICITYLIVALQFSHLLD